MMTVKQSVLRCIPVAALVGITVGLCLAFPNAAENSETGMILKLPGLDGVPGIPGHVAIERPTTKEEKKWLPPDTGILKMLYVPTESTATELGQAAEDGISASLILGGNDRRSLHRPHVCLRAQGWHIARKEKISVVVGGQDLEVMDYTLLRKINEEDGTVRRVRAHYLYWWIGANRSTPSDFERILLTVLDNMFRNLNNRWGYPSVMVYADIEGATTPEEVAEADKKALQRATSFIQQYAPLFQKALGAVDAE